MSFKPGDIAKLTQKEIGIHNWLSPLQKKLWQEARFKIVKFDGWITEAVLISKEPLFGFKPNQLIRNLRTSAIEPAQDKSRKILEIY